MNRIRQRGAAVPQVLLVAVLGTAGMWVGPGRADDRDRLPVGVQPDGRILVPTNQVLTPAGRQITFPGRPVDLALTDDGQTLVVKNMRNLVFLDVATIAVKQTLASPVGFSVVGLVAQGGRVYARDARDHVRVAERQPDGRYQWGQSIKLARPKVGGAAHPAGIALDAKGHLWVTATRGNSVQRIDPTAGRVEEVIPVNH